jgi:ribonuclease HI
MFTDGTADGAPGDAAFGFLMGYCDGKGFAIETGKGIYDGRSTIGRMEAKAVMAAVVEFHGLRLHMKAAAEASGQMLPPELGMRPLIIADSEYMVKTLQFQGYIDRWETNGYIKANGDPVHNDDVMKHLARLRRICPFDIVHMRGHLKWQKHEDVQSVMYQHGVSAETAKQMIYWNGVVDAEIAKTRITRGSHRWPTKYELRW